MSDEPTSDFADRVKRASYGALNVLAACGESPVFGLAVAADMVEVSIVHIASEDPERAIALFEVCATRLMRLASELGLLQSKGEQDGAQAAE